MDKERLCVLILQDVWSWLCSDRSFPQLHNKPSHHSRHAMWRKDAEIINGGNSKCCAHVDTPANHAAVFSVLCRDQVHSNEQVHASPSAGRVFCIGAHVSTGFGQLRTRQQSIWSPLWHIRQIKVKARSQAWAKETKQTLRAAKQYL